MLMRPNKAITAIHGGQYPCDKLCTSVRSWPDREMCFVNSFHILFMDRQKGRAIDRQRAMCVILLLQGYALQLQIKSFKLKVSQLSRQKIVEKMDF